MLIGAPVLSLDAWRLGRSQVADPVAPAETPAAGARRAIRPDQRAARLAAVSGGRPTSISDVEAGRRAVLATGGVGAAFVLAAGLDAGIGRAVRRDDRKTLRTAAAPTPSHPAAGQSASPTAPAKHQTGTRVASAADVPVGGAKPFTDPGSGAPAYLVQPSRGDFRAFSAVCTHAGCTVAFVKGSEQFQCPCHGGVYDAKTGQVLGGPPPAPLGRITVHESNGQLIVPKGA
jgi:thiosulfate dehydrogenase [quinone] large subunit